MQQATNMHREVEETASATILNFKVPGDRTEKGRASAPAKDIEAACPARRPLRFNGIALGFILLPGTMAIMELMRIVFTD